MIQIQPVTRSSTTTPARRMLASVVIILLAAIAPPVAAQLLPPVDDGSETLARVQASFESLVDRIGPSVVTIDAQSSPGGQRSAGSGFVVRADGMILTSEHVLTEAISIHVILHDGRRYRAKRVAADPRCDLAILQIDAKALLPLAWGDSGHLRRGSIVLAFGNPLNMAEDGRAAASFGLVSAIARPLPESFGQDEDRYYGDMIQTTAPIAPGCSGGPLIDIHGCVVGVLTAVAHPVATAGLGFAVPIGPRTRGVIDKLLAGNDIEYGYLGVQVRDLRGSNPAIDGLPISGKSPESDGLPGRAALQSIYPGGPADRSGMQAGDIILTVDDVEVVSADHFVQVIGAIGPDAETRISYLRDAKRRTCTPRLGRRRPSVIAAHPENSATELSFRGATLVQTAPEMREQAGAPAGSMLVLLVAVGSPADRAGLTPGDIIVRVNGASATPEPGGWLGQSNDCLLGLANGGSVLVKAK